MSMRAAIYARYSTELQSNKSIEDQVVLCRRFAQQNGCDVVDVYSDAAKSGASMVNRDGIKLMLEHARAGRFDAVIAESVDRLGRDTEDLASMYKRLNYMGVKVLVVNGGVMNSLLIAVMSGVAQSQREETAEKVRRGMEGLVRNKRSAGGVAYGYRANPETKGEFIPVPEQVEVVREIFRRYVAGKSPRDDRPRPEQAAGTTATARIKMERIYDQRLWATGQWHPA